MGEIIFHIATVTDWSMRRDTYVPEQFVTEGFIHCSTASQLMDVANRMYRGRDDLVILSIDPERIKPGIRYENLEGGEQQYPHIYGPLNIEAVIEYRHTRISQDGNIYPARPDSHPDS